MGMSKKILVLTILVTLQFCSKDSHPNYFGTIIPKHGADELWTNISTEPQHMDPNKMAGEIELNAGGNMFVRLVGTAPKTGEPIPDFATSWDVSSDGKEYTFHLRTDAKWSDGVPVTAHDVEYSWKRLIDPKTGAVYSSMADIIEGALAFRTGKGKVEDVKVKAKDDHTVWVRLTSPVSYFLGLLEYVPFAPVPKHVIEKFKAQGKEDEWTKLGNIVINGPFKLKEEQFKQYKLYEKNPDYYNASKVRLNKVKAIMIESYSSDLNAYQTGQHDWSCCNAVPPEALDRVRIKKDFHLDEFLAVYFYMMNTKKKPLDDARVRRALSLAIDREALVTNVTRGGQKPTRNLVPFGIPGYKGPDTSIHNPEEARKLLAQAGFPEGKGFPNLSIKYNTAETHKLIAEAVQQMWKKELNIDIELANVEWSVFLEDQKAGNFQIMRRAWNGDYIDPFTFLGLLNSDGTNNKTGWKNKAFDDLLAKSNNERDRTKRFAILADAEKILAEEQPYVPIYSYTRGYMKKPYVKGLWAHPMDRHDWKYIWIDERWAKGVPEKLDIPDEPWF